MLRKEHQLFPDKHTRLSHKIKYTRKKINEGMLEDWKRVMFEEIANARDLSIYTGGRTPPRMFTVTFVLRVLFIVGGFFCPPIGVINGILFSAVGLLLMFATIDKIPEVIKAGRNLKISKGDFSIESSSEQQD